MLTEKDIPLLARKTVEDYVLYGKLEDINDELDENLKRKAGVFVTIKKNGKLRGCIGTVKATQKNVAEEIQKNAISAAEHDPRFPAIKSKELEELEYSVDVLGDMKKVDTKDKLNPKKYGIMVKGGHQSGLLLPDLEGIDTVEKQINVARKKAGLSVNADVEIFRFEVHRYRE